MEPLSKTPRPLACILNHPLAQQPVMAPVAVTSSRVVAAVMQLKDTVNILLLLSNGALLIGIVMGFGVPGLVLYALRWRQVRGRVGRGAITGQTMLSLGHEVFWMHSFYEERTASEPFEHYVALTMLYGLGALLSVVQLLVTLLSTATANGYYTSLIGKQRGE